MALTLKRRCVRALFYAGLGFVLGALALFPIGPPYVWMVTGAAAAAFCSIVAALFGPSSGREGE